MSPLRDEGMFDSRGAPSGGSKEKNSKGTPTELEDKGGARLGFSGTGPSGVLGGNPLDQERGGGEKDMTSTHVGPQGIN